MAEPELFGDWTETGAFRETFLWHAERESAAAFRAVGTLLLDWLLEYTPLREVESHVRAGLRAALAELRYLGGFLWNDVGKDAEAYVKDVALARKARPWARQVARLADAIEAAIGPPPGEPAGDPGGEGAG